MDISVEATRACLKNIQHPVERWSLTTVRGVLSRFGGQRPPLNDEGLFLR